MLWPTLNAVGHHNLCPSFSFINTYFLDITTLKKSDYPSYCSSNCNWQEGERDRGSKTIQNEIWHHIYDKWKSEASNLNWMIMFTLMLFLEKQETGVWGRGVGRVGFKPEHSVRKGGRPKPLVTLSRPTEHSVVDYRCSSIVQLHLLQSNILKFTIRCDLKIIR